MDKEKPSFVNNLDELIYYCKGCIGGFICSIPIASYAMFAYLAVKMFIISRKCESLEGRRCARVLTIFAFPSMLFSCFQVFVYGSTMAQAGYTIAVLIIYNKYFSIFRII